MLATSTCNPRVLTRNPEEEPRLLGNPSVLVFYATSVPGIPKRGLPQFTENPRRLLLGHPYTVRLIVICVRIGPKSQFAPRWTRWGTHHVARQHTYAVGERSEERRV